MPPTIYLVRHGEAENNVGVREEANKTRDALLTPHGKSQCRHLRATFPYHDTIGLVLSSPLRRAIQSASIAFGPAIVRPEVKYLVTPLAQEISDLWCDVGHDAAELGGMLGGLVGSEDVGFDVRKVDLGLVWDGWNSKTGIYAPDDEALKRRAAMLRSWLFRREESDIVLVTHGAYMHYLTEDWTGDDPNVGTAYLNCEVRIFKFTGESTAEDAHFVEDEESKNARSRPKEQDPQVIEELEAVAS